MSSYDNRGEEFCGDPFWAPADWCNNKYILKFWESKHDELILEEIDKWQWEWDSITFHEKLQAMIPTSALEEFKNTDPLCKQYAWYNILIGFARSRAYVKGYLNKIRPPQWKTCPLCNHRFVENSLPVPFIRRLTINQIDFCSPCLTKIFFSENNTLSKEDQMNYIANNKEHFNKRYFDYVQNLAKAIGKIPSQSYGTHIYDLWNYSTEERIEILNLLSTKPHLDLVKNLYGSWFTLLCEAGVLDNGSIKTARGIHCLAQDNHLCLSLGEKTIDDFLYLHNIPHKKEPSYPFGNFRADFIIGSTFVEYFGLTGNPEYDEKTKLKKSLCKQHGIELIAIFPKDLTDTNKLKRLFKRFIKTENMLYPV